MRMKLGNFMVEFTMTEQEIEHQVDQFSDLMLFCQRKKIMNFAYGDIPKDNVENFAEYVLRQLYDLPKTKLNDSCIDYDNTTIYFYFDKYNMQRENIKED